MLSTLEWTALVLTLSIALAFQPWRVLAHRPAQHPWLAAMVMLPWMWWTRKLLPSGMALHMSGACMMVLMFGWPMAMLMLLPIGVLAALIDIYGPQRLTRAATTVVAVPDWSMAPDLLWQRADAIVSQVVWMGIIPATIALMIGLALRRWLPRHLFVFILGRGFMATAVSIAITGVLGLWAGRMPDGLDPQEWMIGHWLLGWGEAISTGMLTAIFVAFKPQWMLTYSDARYLPDTRPRR